MNREVREIVNYNCQALEESAKDFESIYKVMFRLSDNVLAETNDGYQIQTYTYGEIRFGTMLFGDGNVLLSIDENGETLLKEMKTDDV